MAQRIPFMTVAFSTLHGLPHSAVLLNTIDRDWNVYFISDPHSYKHQLITDNPRASLAMYELGNIYVQMNGTVKIVSGPQIQKLLNLISKKATNVKGFCPPILTVGTGEYTLYRFEPNWIRVLPLADLPIHSTQPPFVRIL